MYEICESERQRLLLYPSEPFCPASRQLTPEHLRLEHLLMGSCVSAITANLGKYCLYYQRFSYESS